MDGGISGGGRVAILVAVGWQNSKGWPWAVEKWRERERKVRGNCLGVFVLGFLCLSCLLGCN